MKILILSPHTDDAELGCGGSICKFLKDGHEILWVVFSIAEESLPENMPKDLLNKEFLDVVELLNLTEKNYAVHKFKVRKFQETRQGILDELVKIRGTFKPDLVIIPSLNDFHQDHQVVSTEAVRAFKQTASIIGYELPWNHLTFDSTLFIKLEKSEISKKYELLQRYKSQCDIKNYFSQEYIFGLAKMRGVQCSSEYAEAFEVLRWRL
jgi:N-acetylglucosamine malate deacetylase 1